eukprot:scaffold25961_cov63-Phaeocystis_antarctica.AAC.3
MCFQASPVCPIEGVSPDLLRLHGGAATPRPESCWPSEPARTRKRVARPNLPAGGSSMWGRGVSSSEGRFFGLSAGA